MTLPDRLLLGWLDAAVLGTFVAIALWVLLHHVRVRPAVRHLLWLVVALRFLVPSGAGWSWRPFDAAVPASWVAVASVAVAPSSAVGGRGAALDARDPAPAGRAPVFGLGLRELLLTLWLSSAVLVVLVRLIRYARWRADVERGPSPPAAFEEDVAAVARILGVEPPRTVLSPNVTTPLIVGCGRPLLVWPAAPRVRSHRTARRTVLAHELAHLRRKDHWLGWIELLIGTLWWWYPPARRVCAELSAAAEEACDRWVVAVFPAERRRYAETLCAVAEMGSSTPSVPALASSLSGLAVMKRRLQSVARPGGRADSGWGGRALALLAAGMVLPTSVFMRANTRLPVAEMAGIVGRGAVELGSSGTLSVGANGWVVGFRDEGRDFRAVFSTSAGTVVLDASGTRTTYGAADRAWLARVARETNWSVDPRLRLSASGALVPQGPHMHRPTKTETVAVWSSVPRPFDDGGRLAVQASVDHPVVVVTWYATDREIRLYRLWRDPGGTVVGETYTEGGKTALPDPGRLIREVAAGLAG